MKTRIMHEEKSFSLFQGHSLHLGSFLALSKHRELVPGITGGGRCVDVSGKATPPLQKQVLIRYRGSSTVPVTLSVRVYINKVSHEIKS